MFEGSLLMLVQAFIQTSVKQECLKPFDDDCLWQIIFGAFVIEGFLYGIPQGSHHFTMFRKAVVP